ncbi:MAG: metallophosphoesterase [Nanoarchaeota archaeon]|nr:metallophosphoesterase [Nanoarchaeota archaeon]
MKYEFVDKALFFPEQGILVIGDLHIGYDYMIRQSGVLIPERQVKDIISDLKRIFREIKTKNLGNKINKIVFLGDIKHAFSYEAEEKHDFLEVMKFLEQEIKIPEENIILIKGNHDTIDFTYGNMVDYYIESGIAFLHGHESFSEIFDKKVQMVVSGHLHPSITLAEKLGVKKESYKCFLEGNYKGKIFIVVPSFVDYYEGTPVNDYRDDYLESFFIVPKREMLKFKVHVIGKDKIYDFGRVGDL